MKIRLNSLLFLIPIFGIACGELPDEADKSEPVISVAPFRNNLTKSEPGRWVGSDLVSRVNRTLKDLGIESQFTLVKDADDTINMRIADTDIVIELFYFDSDLPRERQRFDFAAAGDMAIMYKSSKQNEAEGRLCEACAAVVLAIASEQEISTDDFGNFQLWFDADSERVRSKGERSVPLTINGVRLSNDRTGAYLSFVADKKN